MGGETIAKAYEPHINAVKNLLKTYAEMVRSQLPEILAKWEKFVKKALDEMETVVQACLKSCEAQILKLVTKARMYADETVRAAAKFLQVTVARMEKKIRATIADIRNNPQVREYV